MFFLSFRITPVNQKLISTAIVNSNTLDLGF